MLNSMTRGDGNKPTIGDGALSPVSHNRFDLVLADTVSRVDRAMNYKDGWYMTVMELYLGKRKQGIPAEFPRLLSLTYNSVNGSQGQMLKPKKNWGKKKAGNHATLYFCSDKKINIEKDEIDHYLLDNGRISLTKFVYDHDLIMWRGVKYTLPDDQ
ncbi:hypothetical protein ACOME3_003811 [Neoechinorhynchus agilis]